MQQFFTYKDKFSMLLAILSFGISVLNSVISKSRAELIAILLPFLFLCENYKKVSRKKLIALLVGSLLLFGVWKSLFSSGSKFLYYDSEFSTWYEICENVFERDLKPLYGKSYFDTLLNLVVPFTDTEPLSIWYVKNFEYDTWVRGGGRGFSAALEAFLNFGVLGNAIIYGIYGWLLKQVQFNMEKDDDKSIIIYMILLVSMFQFFRSESYSLWKNMMWFRVYPALILMWVSDHVTIKARSK
jgi:oligosaccharide repeat unit polymerase